MNESRTTLQRSTLIASSLAVVVVMFNVAAVNPALPALQRTLQIAPTDVPWAVNVYNIVYAAFLLVGGLLGARLGFRRTLLAGLTVGAAGALLAALAPSFNAVLLGRGISGLSSALVQPASLVLLTLAFTEPAARARAIGLWAGVSGLGIAIGPVLGGVLVDAFGWTSVFWTLALASLTVGWIARRGTRPTAALPAKPIDLTGLILITFTLAALIYGLTQGNGLGWTSPAVLACLTGAGIAFTLFVWVQRHVQAPLVPLNLFRNPAYTAANLGGLVVFFGPFSLLVFFTILLQGVLHFTATRAGLITALFPLGTALGSTLGGRLTARRGERLTATLGLSLTGLGILLLTGITLTMNGWDLWWKFALMGLGVGLSLGALTTAAMASAPQDQLSQASSVLNALRQVGVALGVATLGAVIARHPGGSGSAFLFGLRDALWLAGTALLVGAPALWWAMGRTTWTGPARPPHHPVQDLTATEP
ncbi:MFS transporter [Deinococcus aquiradiocola]|uniref:MFS transporter n=1 Tax=Deinococcus aquiradiocola TaxID=393059 RepID=A0A917UQL5_9DEIO|nr:MFS transporter [Deinococcus aquiradiocola]GGJ77690.1 MFS transporter [Deinococcus aquiradiocola]